MQLVTDGENNWTQEERLAYETTGETTIIDETLEGANGEYGTTTSFPTPTVGNVYKVTFNGVDYEVTAKSVNFDGIDFVMLGNAGRIGEEDTGEPFLFIVIPTGLEELFGEITAVLQQTEDTALISVTLKIVGETTIVKPIDPKYLGSLRGQKEIVLTPNEDNKSFTASCSFEAAWVMDEGELQNAIRIGGTIGSASVYAVSKITVGSLRAIQMVVMFFNDFERFETPILHWYASSGRLVGIYSQRGLMPKNGSFEEAIPVLDADSGHAEAIPLSEVKERLDITPFIVTITETDGNYTADHYTADIYAAHQAGKKVYAVYGGAMFGLVYAGATQSTFTLLSIVDDAGTGTIPAAEYFLIGTESVMHIKHVMMTEDDKAEIEDSLMSLSEEIVKRDKPIVYINGTIPTTKDDVLAELTYVHGDERWHAYLEIKCQGSSSMSYPKKNFTIKLFSDEARTVKLKKKMHGWSVNTNKYVLKANWIDHSHARNIVTANLWSEVVASRPDYESLPVELRNSPNNGAVDGFPIIVYTNGVYQGLYTWNLGKEDWLWGMDEDNPDHALLCGEYNNDGMYRESACNFRALWSGIDEDGWAVEVGTISDSLKTSVNALISCVKDTDDATFKATIGNHLDVQSAIDYFCFCLADNGIDSLGKNLMIGRFTPNKWIVGAYDLDSTWGLDWNGVYIYPPTHKVFPDGYQESTSLLLARFIKLFKIEMIARARELRKWPLCASNILSKFEAFTSEIGKEAYADDLVPYPDIPSASDNNIWQLRNFVQGRLDYYDAWMDALADSVPCESVAISASEIAFDTVSTQTLTASVAPTNATDNVRWFSSNKNVVQVANGVLTPVGNGLATVAVVCGAKTALCNVTVTAFAMSGDNLWNISGRNGEHVNGWYAAATPAPIDFSTDKYFYAVTAGGIWDGTTDIVGIDLDGEDVSVYSVDYNESTGNYRGGYGVLVPFELETGAKYKIRYEVTNRGNICIMYYNAEKVFQKFRSFNNSLAEGTNTYEVEFEAEDYAYAALNLVTSEPSSDYPDRKSIFRNIELVQIMSQ